MDDKILVEIAAYKDPELLNTVMSAITQAEYPDRVYFSICYQSNDDEMYQELLKIKNCRIIHLNEEEAKGSCYARYLCQKLIEDEKYIFQVDSHMRFVKHWDSEMINMLLSLNDPKASISFYPPDCSEDMMTYPFNHEAFDNPCSGGVMYTRGFQDGDSYFLSNLCEEVAVSSNRKPSLNPFISGGNFFSFADIHRNILHDPEMYFYGDELPMAIRYYTNGWNNYSAGKCYVYHKYNRKGQTFPNSTTHNVSIEIERFRKLLNIDHDNYDLGEFGLGSVRTLKDYEEFAGIDFKKKLVSIAAETGKFDQEELKKQVSYFTKEKSKNNLFISKPEKIEVVVIDYEGDYKDCITSCLEHSVYKNNISFIVGSIKKSISKNIMEKYSIKKYISIEKNMLYSHALSQLVDYLDKDSYTTIIDSSVHFLQGWDKFYVESIKKCGNNACLTSWVWYDEEGIVDEKFSPYINVSKEFNGFYNYLPTFKYNENVNLSNKKYPYKGYAISDGFLFCKGSILQDIKIDPNLRYDEHNCIYSLRLWTNGYDFYYPNTSFFYRIRCEENLNFGEYHFDVDCSLFQMDNILAKSLKGDYSYGLGKNRLLWEWYESIGFDYINDTSFNVLF